MEKMGVVDNDCGLSNLWKLVEKNVTYIAEYHLLGGSRFGNSGVHMFGN